MMLRVTMAWVWEQRWHPLREEWVLFTSHRGGRPWVGDTVAAKPRRPPAHDPTCALCPGNARIRGANPPYTAAYCFTNDLPCFSTESPEPPPGDSLYARRRAFGTAEVVCYHPDHAKTFADLLPAEAESVVRLWRDRTAELGAREGIDHVLIFENKGSLVGTSNPHPHCQIYAGNMIYGLTAREAESGRRHHRSTGRYLAPDIAAREADSPRFICGNDSFIACVPWFARYAYEVLVLPRRQVHSLTALDGRGLADLAEVMREVTIRYDNLWRMPMPYVMAVHQAPTDGGDHAAHPFHIEFHPPLRKPDTLKYLAGPEIGGGSMTNESDPDEKAAELRAVPATLLPEAREWAP
jgi:UDPglucose--hexose-1-phosphate uridylyltransferase